MKKFLALFAALFLLLGCSNDDDNEPLPEDDPIEGTWYLADWTIPIDGPSECQRQSNITFSDDGTSQSEFFNEEDEECVSESDSGDWTREANGQYTFNVPNFGRQTGNVDFEGENRFVFSLSGGSITFEKR